MVAPLPLSLSLAPPLSLDLCGFFHALRFVSGLPSECHYINSHIECRLRALAQSPYALSAQMGNRAYQTASRSLARGAVSRPEAPTSITSGRTRIPLHSPAFRPV